MRLRALALVAAFLVAALPAAAKLPCGAKDKACLLKAAKKNPVRTLDFWAKRLAEPIGERIGPAPQELVDYLEIDNALNGFPEKPRVAKLSPEFLADARGALSDLLPVLRKIAGPTFAGVYFIEDLGGTGFTDAIRDKPGAKPAAAYIVLDAKVLEHHRANGWATWKENTPFKPGDGWKLEATIEEPAEDTRRSAIRYILLHEFGHVVAATRDLHPMWDVSPKDLPANGKWPFFDLSWTMDRAKSTYASRFDASFPLRKSVVYYLGAKLEASQMTPAYKALDATNYPTLYGATSFGDDFAESFASYVHTVILKRPWLVRITKDGQPDFAYRTCWDDPRCIEKREILENLLR
jgi:hypothetical protein